MLTTPIKPIIHYNIWAKILGESGLQPQSPMGSAAYATYTVELIYSGHPWDSLKCLD